ncbi:porin family protein [Lacihabitans sp. LS3-19]|uniref:porin family protein n=1 Tax=Lacihabitans sp. LS3-19 TaxID=2487335 RepID=UPI0020CDA0CB|nr:porin family protein [Lacihabitans sp. LS3-19]
MKKIVLIAFSCLYIISAKVNAQDRSWGVMAGVNGSMVTKLSDNTTFKPGGNLGIFMNQSNHSRTGMKVELLYTQMGSGFENTNSTLDLHYIQLPVYGVWYLNEKGNKLRPKLMAGPYVGALIGANGSNTENYSYRPVNFKKIDVGLRAAMGLNYRLNEKIWLNSEVYFAQGFFDNFKSEDTKTMINQSYGLNVGVSFPFK